MKLSPRFNSLIRFALAVGVVSCLSGCAHVDTEALGTLLEQSQEEAAKSELVRLETQNFKVLRSVIRAGGLQTGISSEEIIARFGEPSTPVTNGTEKWLYKSGGSSWFNAPRIALYLDAEKRLSRWECMPKDICVEMKADALS